MVLRPPGLPPEVVTSLLKPGRLFSLPSPSSGLTCRASTTWMHQQITVWLEFPPFLASSLFSYLSCMWCLSGTPTRTVLWIRIRIKLKGRIRIRGPDPHQSDKLDADPHQFADDSQNVWNMSLFEHFFKVLSLYLEAKIRVRIKVKGSWKLRSESGSK